MARLISNTKEMVLGVKIITVFEDGRTTERLFRTGDIVENLRYVSNNDISIVSGKITGIGYSVANKITFNKNNPTDTLTDDIAPVSFTIDASKEYESNIVTVPLNEVVEWEDETDVARMKYGVSVAYKMKMRYSDNSVKELNIEVGDSFNNVRIMNPNDLGNDITGKFTVEAFAYSLESKRLVINGLVLRGEDDSLITANTNYILSLNEVYVHALEDTNDIASTVAELADGDTLNVSVAIDNSSESGGIVINGKKDITVKMDADYTTANSNGSNLTVQNSSVTFAGTGVFKASAPYDSAHSTTVIKLAAGSDVTFNGSGIDTVLEDANKGHFGVGVFDNANVTFNAGDFNAGWYSLATNGGSQNRDACGNITINGGKFTSAYDFCLYFPANDVYTINGGTFDGPAGCVSINAGELYINGGTFSTTGEGSKTTEVYSSDGTYNSIASCLNLNARYNDVKCRITGGTFISGNNEVAVITIGAAHNTDLKISGGYFSAPIINEDWLEEGYSCTKQKNSDGLYYVDKTDKIPAALLAD